MEAISFRLKELEKVEAGLYLAKQVTLKSRGRFISCKTGYSEKSSTGRR